jgi:hypothetical protein
MAPVSQIKPTYSGGEISPAVWGRTDLAAWHASASVMRNCFVNYRGPASSRAGTAYVIQSSTPASASSLPPRIIKFQFSISQSYILEFGVDALSRSYMRVIANGSVITETPVAVSAISQANPCIVTIPGNTDATGDWLFLSGSGLPPQLQGRTVVSGLVSGNNVTINDLFGNPINSLNFAAYTGGATAARIYTTFSSPYQLADLPYLKVVQSADVMSLCCVNQETGTEYPPIDLSRLAANNWDFTETTFASAINAPTGCTATTSVTGSPATQYAYCVTAVDSVTGEESIASNVAYITNSDDIAVVAGSHTITWNPVAGAASYNVYQAPPSYDTPVPVGSAFGYLGTTTGTQFVNTNILADFSTTPPLALNPFAPSQILSVGTIPSAGTFAQATTSATINTTTGSGGVIIPVVVGGIVVAAIVQNGGQNYNGATDTVTFTDSGTSATVTAGLDVGPATGNYPAVPNYFQSRRVYANTLNNPDTVFASQTGAYTNMDQSFPPVDSDAIITTPWGQQVNGISAMQPMPGGLILGTGLDAWQLSGAGGAGSTWTPASESAQPQESNGFSATLPLLRVNYDILYVQQNGTVVRDLQYNFFVNIYAGTDISLLSSHLFDDFQMVTWAWAKVPWKIVWATRSDGKFLSLTFDKEEQLKGWARHDTNGLVAGNEVATEPPVDAPYFIVKRFIVGENQWAYYIERMDNRLWEGPEDPWCVDAGLALEMPEPAATLTAAAAEGPGTISGGYLPNGGQNYTSPSAQINDPAGTGSGADIAFTVAGGVITAFTIVSPGQDYSPGTTVAIMDQTGAGATFVPLVSQNVLFSASAAVFANNNPGDVIRIGGGQGVVQQIVSPSEVLAAITVPIIQTIPDDPNNLPAPAPSGDWSISTPVSQITNLYHLEGMQVTGLADGAVIPLSTVTNGTVALQNPASSVKVGLPFIAQLQAMPVEIASVGTIQGDRKRIQNATVRMKASRGFQLFANQPVAAALDFQREIPWTNGADLPDIPSVNVPAAALPLYTGDAFALIDDDWQSWDGWSASMGMLAAQQLQPLPMDILALIGQFNVGDNKAAG